MYIFKGEVAYRLKFKEIKRLTRKKSKKNLILRAFFCYFLILKTNNCKFKKLLNVK